jgi:hypothetical protein
MDELREIVQNQLREIVLFAALSMRGHMKKKLGDLVNRQYFHLLGMDVIFDSDGNPWILELNDRPSMIRRPIDNNEEQNIQLLQGKLAIVLGIVESKGWNWEMLYPEIPTGLTRMSWAADEFKRLEDSR